MDVAKDLTAGGRANLVASCILNPCDGVKVRLQAREHLGRYRNTWNCLRRVCESEGVLALFLGLRVTLHRAYVWNGVYFCALFCLFLSSVLFAILGRAQALRHWCVARVLVVLSVRITCSTVAESESCFSATKRRANDKSTQEHGAIEPLAFCLANGPPPGRTHPQCVPKAQKVA